MPAIQRKPENGPNGARLVRVASPGVATPYQQAQPGTAAHHHGRRLGAPRTRPHGAAVGPRESKAPELSGAGDPSCVGACALLVLLAALPLGVLDAAMALLREVLR